MKNPLKILSLAGMVAIYASCGTPEPKIPPVPKLSSESKRSYAAEYGYTGDIAKSLEFDVEDTINKILPDKVIDLEGRIVDIQSSNISYRSSPGSQTGTSPNHCFEYVVINDSIGDRHILIYPYSKCILKGNAHVRYRPLKYGLIDSKIFLETFIDKPGIYEQKSNENSSANMPLEAEGIITGNMKTTDGKMKKGITYIENNNSIYR